MRLLLDTHAFIWWVNGDARLSKRAHRQVASARNEVFVSAVTAWEFAVKKTVRFDVSRPIETSFPDQIARNGFEALPLSIEHALAVERLPDHHADPFDRLLVAQALVEGMTLVSRDRRFAAYPVNVLW